MTQRHLMHGGWKLGGAALAAAAALAACGGGGGGDAGTGTLRMALTDAPACGWDHVYVTVERVGVNASGTAGDSDAGWREIVLATPQRIDLLSLTNGVLAELGQADLPAGRYSQIRLVLSPNTSAAPLANAVQPTGGALVALTTPSGQQSGLKISHGFDVAAGQTADLVLDFDACRSVVKRGNSGAYNLKPVISAFARITTGIEGYVAPSLAAGTTTVSAQQGGATVRATAPDPVTGRFFLPYLPAGSYDLVVSSDGFSTAVVPGVPASSAATTTVNGTATAILPPVSSMREVSGTVNLATGAPATDATLRVLQDLPAVAATTGTPGLPALSVELASQAVDPLAATYRVRLPLAAPVRATYSGGLLGAFNPDTSAAGQVRLQASAPGRTAVERPVPNLGTATLPLDLTFAP